MIDKIQSQNVSFGGKSFSAKQGAQKLSEFSRKVSDCYMDSIPAETFRAYAPISKNSNVNLLKTEFGYRAPDSIELTPYHGSTLSDAGFSTEAGGFGGGWIQAGINTPLSTSGIHSCALLNLVNDDTQEQFLYHVYDQTKAKHIIDFIKEQFPSFTKVNLVAGDNPLTNRTLNNVLEGVDSVNPKAQKTFYHFSTPKPEVVAQNGKLTYMPNQKPERVTFNEVSQYHDYDD